MNKTLHLDNEDAVDLGGDYHEIRHLQWSVRQNYDAEMEQELFDLVIKNKERVGKVCSLTNSNNGFKGNF